MKTAKRILTKTKKADSDLHIALLDHRNTPSQGLSTSPSQRLMNRRTQTLLPTSSNLLQPRIVDDKAKMKIKVGKQAENFNKSAKKVQPLEVGDTVRMKPLVRGNKTWEKAVVSQRLDERSYRKDCTDATECIFAKLKKIRLQLHQIRRSVRKYTSRESNL